MYSFSYEFEVCSESKSERIEKQNNSEIIILL